MEMFVSIVTMIKTILKQSMNLSIIKYVINLSDSSVEEMEILSKSVS